MRRSGLRVVSLFSGAGGLDIAFCDAAEVAELFSTDSQPVFLQTLVSNLPLHFPSVRHKHAVLDVRLLTAQRISEDMPGAVDLVIGGPPCDDFTTYGKKRGMRGKKGPTIFEFARLVGEIRPRCFLFENVPSLRGMCATGFEELLKRLSAHGYSVYHSTLAANEFGAPTVRQRLFVVGFRMDTAPPCFEFPTATHGIRSERSLFDYDTELLPYVTVGEALKGLPDVKAPEASRHLNHTGRFHRPETIRHMMTVPQGVAISKSYRYRPALDGLCRSLTAGLDSSTKSYLHPIYHREMSVREYARLHCFPDSWEFAGTHHNGIKQVANAVPIPLGKAVATAVVRCLDRS